ncbi:MAG: hypothetical protein FWG06_00635 [Clostridiales bacterium]|nr:hypothetical protein [Clostridiales bacterium]
MEITEYLESVKFNGDTTTGRLSSFMQGELGLKNLVNIFHIIVAVLAALVIMSIFYEGMRLQWFSFVPTIMLATDGAFILATICNLIYFRKRKALFALNLFSIAIIIAALALEMFDQAYPDIFVVFWNFYIFLCYYTFVIKQLWKYPV